MEKESMMLSEDDIAGMRKHFHIPEGVTLRIPSPGDKPSGPRPGEVCVHLSAFESGLRLPFHPFIRTVLAHICLAPSQLGPSAWRCLAGAIILWRICSNDQDHITLDEFLYCYKFKPKMSLWYLIQRANGRSLVLGRQQSPPHWYETFIFASVSPEEGISPAPPVPKDWGFVEKDKMEEPILNDVYMSRVNRALAFDCKRRNYINLITPENINKYLLNNVPTLLPPSLENASFRINPRIFPKSLRLAKGRKRSSGTNKICSNTRRKLMEKSNSSTTQTNSTHPNSRPVVAESSSSESSVQIVKKGPALLHDDDLILERVRQLLTPDEMKQMKELGSKEALQTSIVYSAKAVAMMIALCGQMGVDNKQMSKHKEMVDALHKTQSAYVDQLVASYKLSKDVEILKIKLGKTEKSVKDRDDSIRGLGEDMHAKDQQIKSLKEAATNAVKKFRESEEYEGLMAQCYLSAYQSFCSQASSSVPSCAHWPSLEPVSSCEEKPKCSSLHDLTAMEFVQLEK